MNKKKIHTAFMTLAAFMLLPFPTQAQDTSRNYVRTVTMLDAGADGGTACTLTAYDALGREKRKYAPVPGNGFGYMTEDVPVAGKGHLIVNGENFDSHVFNRIRKNK